MLMFSLLSKRRECTVSAIAKQQPYGSKLSMKIALDRMVATRRLLALHEI